MSGPKEQKAYPVKDEDFDATTQLILKGIAARPKGATRINVGAGRFVPKQAARDLGVKDKEKK